MRHLVCLALAALLAVGCGGKTPKEREESRALARKQNLAQIQEAEAVFKEYVVVVTKDAGEGKGFVRNDDLAPIDSWGNRLQVKYDQEWFEEVATIRSAGPDQKFGTPDDLVVQKRVNKPGSVLLGLNFWGWFAIVWLITGMLALLFSAGIRHRRHLHGKKSTHRHPASQALVTVLVAPVAFLVYGFLFVGGTVAGMLGEMPDYFDGSDFYYD